MKNFLTGWKRRAAFVLVCVIFGLAIIFSTMVRKNSSSREAAPDKQGAQAEAAGAGVISLSPEKLAVSGIEAIKVSREPVQAPLMATAAIELNADRTSRISPRVTGRIIKVNVSQGDRVRPGHPLAFIDTVELDQIWAEYRKNKGRLELARKNLKREESLFEKNVAPEKDVLKARQDLSEAEADLTFSRERFRLLGIDVASAETQKNGDANVRPLIPIISSVGGVVIEKSVTQGETVSPEKLLFVVADVSTLWVLVDIYDKDMARLKTGAVVHVSVTAFPDKVFQGRISYIGDIVDERTRTVKARVTIDNHDGFLKPGMFATVSIDSGKGGQVEEIIAIPEEAVLIDGSDRYAFVQVGKGAFKRKDVTTGRSLGGRIEVKDGLQEGDLLVVKGTFPLKSEYKRQLLKAE